MTDKGAPPAPWKTVAFVGATAVFNVYLAYVAYTWYLEKDPYRSLSFNGDGIVWQIPHSLVPEFEDLRKEWIEEFKSANISFDPDAAPIHGHMRAMLERPPFAQTDVKLLDFFTRKIHRLPKDRTNNQWYQNGGHLTLRQMLSSKSNKTGRNQWLMRYFDDFDGMNNTGFFYYPPGAYREWHTNENDLIGYRLYYVQVDKPDASWLYYLMPGSSSLDPTTIRKVSDKTDHYNLFKITKDPVLWHAVYSKEAHRFSVGLNVRQSFIETLLERLANSTDK